MEITDTLQPPPNRTAEHFRQQSAQARERIFTSTIDGIYTDIQKSAVQGKNNTMLPRPVGFVEFWEEFRQKLERDGFVVTYAHGAWTISWS